MEDGLYAHNDDTGEMAGPFIEMEDAKRAAMAWDDGSMVMIHDIVGDRVESCWEYEGGELMREPDLEGREAIVDAGKLMLA
jgi:hypothetical protein